LKSFIYRSPTMSKVYVVVKMWNGLVDDVSVHREEPKDLEPIDEDGDNGNFIYHTEIDERDE
tara:strand:+ start:280 stop:465 length:186 start_codon:yes stop_codon:yes gene_type:complete